MLGTNLGNLGCCAERPHSTFRKWQSCEHCTPAPTFLLGLVFASPSGFFIPACSCLCFARFPGQLVEGEALADDFPYSEAASVCIVHELAVIEAKHLLIEITEQVERFHRNVRALQAAFQKRPEVFHSVSVNFAVDVLHSMIDYLMLKFLQSRV